MHSFNVLRAFNNQLTGQIPSLSGTSLDDFEVQFNQLSGPIPSLSGLPLLYFTVGHNALSGQVPAVPYPNQLVPGLSELCPNPLDHTPDPNWDAATGVSPWYSAVNGCDELFASGFED
jgi:hypothetical protein